MRRRGTDPQVRTGPDRCLSVSRRFGSVSSVSFPVGSGSDSGYLFRLKTGSLSDKIRSDNVGFMHVLARFCPERTQQLLGLTPDTPLCACALTCQGEPNRGGCGEDGDWGHRYRTHRIHTDLSLTGSG
ncbi:hypothetical protein CHARACLAT_033378 [Characodon lateralis]|uniref:Uncharacterized protein n=1 Tax=Characodon lateralis TaxID=208331 RepID=A0ABU7E5M3_9TELE|nr:hypothetical protein [Characodon lateralis]